MTHLEAMLHSPLAGAMYEAPLDLWSITGSQITPQAAMALLHQAVDM